MEKYLRPAAIGTAIGGAAVAVIFGFSHLPSALADDGGPVQLLMSPASELAAPRAIDPRTLVRISDAAWSVTADSKVSLTPIATRTVKKIAFGEVTIVSISRTSSGVYSSDAMTSGHVKYPGIHVQQVYPDEDGTKQSLAYWSPRDGWVPSPAVHAGSFAMITPFAGGTVVSGSQGTCVLTETFASC